MANLSLIELFIVLFVILFLAIVFYAVIRRFVNSACGGSEKERSRTSSPGSDQQRQQSSNNQVGSQTRNIQTIYLGNTNQVGSAGVRSASSIYTIPIRGTNHQNFVVVVRPYIEQPPPTYEECVTTNNYLPPPTYSPTVETV